MTEKKVNIPNTLYSYFIAFCVANKIKNVFLMKVLKI